jgi:hypothetical protein
MVKPMMSSDEDGKPSVVPGRDNQHDLAFSDFG